MRLLGDEEVVTPFLKFLRTTGIGGREGTRERELEWEQKNGQAGENYLDKLQGKKPKRRTHLW